MGSHVLYIITDFAYGHTGLFALSTEAYTPYRKGAHQGKHTQTYRERSFELGLILKIPTAKIEQTRYQRDGLRPSPSISHLRGVTSRIRQTAKRETVPEGNNMRTHTHATLLQE